MDYKQIIKDKGLKQTWLAKHLDVTDAMLSMYIRGKTGMAPEKIKILDNLLRRGT